MRYNFDFIAFGKNIKEANAETHGKDAPISWIPTQHPRDEKRMESFMKLANSHVADGFSLYTLELFPGSQWYNKTNDIQRLQWNEEWIAIEFETLKAIINQAGYSRNEISNFSLMWKQSSHNMVYRTMQSYIWLGINSSSYIDGQRFSNTKHWKKYLAGERQDKESIEILDEKTKKTEQAFLALRTMGWLHEVTSFVELFEEHRKELIATREDAGLVHFDTEKDILKITDSGMNVYNGIITDLIKEL
jgi:oxygen-independent coproporphyrinogen-3 oxidase